MYAYANLDMIWRSYMYKYITYSPEKWRTAPPKNCRPTVAQHNSSDDTQPHSTILLNVLKTKINDWFDLHVTPHIKIIKITHKLYFFFVRHKGHIPFLLGAGWMVIKTSVSLFICSLYSWLLMTPSLSINKPPLLLTWLQSW